MAQFDVDKYKEISQKISHMEKRSDMYDVFSQNDEACQGLRDTILGSVFDGKYTMAYQPHIDKEGSCIGAEALFRLNIDGVFINPAFVFALAGYYGEEKALTLHTLDRVCAESIEFGEKITPYFVTTFNVDPDIFCDFCDEYRAVLEKHHINPHSIAIEMTEGSILTDEVKEKMKKLHDEGTNILIDDFGQGEKRKIDDYAQCYKIPKETVDDIDKNIFKRLNFIIICKSLKRHNKKIIVEGIENAKQNKIAQKYADSIQGYFYSKPIPKADFLEKYTPKENELETISNNSY